MTMDFPLPSPLSLQGGSVDQDILFWETEEEMLWGAVCVSLVKESVSQALGIGDMVLLKVCLTKS